MRITVPALQFYSITGFFGEKVNPRSVLHRLQLVLVLKWYWYSTGAPM